MTNQQIFPILYHCNKANGFFFFYEFPNTLPPNGDLNGRVSECKLLTIKSPSQPSPNPTGIFITTQAVVQVYIWGLFYETIYVKHFCKFQRMFGFFSTRAFH